MEQLARVPVTACSTKAGASAGTTSTLTTANVVQYAIKSKAYSKAAMTNQATPTTDSTTGAAFATLPKNNATVVVLMLNAAGDLKASQGTIVGLNADGSFRNALPQFPAIPGDLCPFAYLVLKNGSTGSDFKFGTNNLSGVTGMTYAFQDIWTLPDRPQSA